MNAERRAGGWILAGVLVCLADPLSGQTMTSTFAETRTALDEVDASGIERVIRLDEFPSLVEDGAEFAERNQAAFARSLRVAADRPGEFQDRLAEASGRLHADSATKTDSLAVVTGLAILSARRERPATAEAAVRGAWLDLLVEAARKATTDQTYVRLFAEGDVRAVATGDNPESTIGTGALGIQVKDHRFLVTALMNVASTADTVAEDFGAIVLHPAAGKILRSGLIDLRFFPFERGGLHGYFTASASDWELDDSSVSRAVPLGWGVTGFYNIAQGFLADTPIGLSVEIGPSFRHLVGDILAESDEIREATLGTDARSFGGIETGFQITFGTLSGALHFYFYPGGDEPVRGLSSGQVVVAFQLMGEVIKGVLGSP